MISPQQVKVVFSVGPYPLMMRVAGQTPDSVARLLAGGQARVVTAERARLIDRAWHATLNALRSFAGRSSPAGEPA